jgi:hypothetical protein
MSSTPAPTTIDERAPLLPPPAPTTQGIPPPVPTAQGIPTPGEEGLDPEDPLVQSGQLPVTPVKRKLTAWAIFWYIILAAVTVVLVVLFVKGIRDADHVDVRTMRSSWTRYLTRMQFDLKKALKTALGGGLSGAAGRLSHSHGVSKSERPSQRWCCRSLRSWWVQFVISNHHMEG